MYNGIKGVYHKYFTSYYQYKLAGQNKEEKTIVRWLLFFLVYKARQLLRNYPFEIIIDNNTIFHNMSISKTILKWQDIDNINHQSSNCRPKRDLNLLSPLMTNSTYYILQATAGAFGLYSIYFCILTLFSSYSLLKPKIYVII